MKYADHSTPATQVTWSRTSRSAGMTSSQAECSTYRCLWVIMDDELERPRSTQHVWARRDAFVAARDIYVTAVLGKSAVQHSFGPAPAYRRERPLFVQY